MSNPKRKYARVVGRFAVAAATLVFALGAAAQQFPSRPVTIIVGYAPGGSNDIMARRLQPKLSERLGVPYATLDEQFRAYLK